MTRSRFKAPQNFLRGAGQALGLDLLSFFADDDTGNQQFEGFAPGFRTSGITKGRGGVLAYKTPKTPTTMTEFTLTPQTQEAPTAATKKAYDFFSAGNLGGPGFGARDLEAAKAAGFSDEDVKNYLTKNQQFFGTGRLSVAQGIIDNLKLNQALNNPDVERDVRAGLYGSGPSGYGLVRMADPKKVTDTLQTPNSQTDTKKFANPLQTQDYKQATTQPRTKGISTEYGQDAKFFGGADLEAARLQGFSDQEIKDYLDASPGLLREQNVPGKGGLYDQLNTKIKGSTTTTTTPTTTTPTTTTGETAARQAKVLDVNRFYSADLGKHFYSSDPNEQSPGGYTKEGLGFKLFDDSDATEGASDVFRLYHPDQRDHLYTTNKAEVESAQRGGYKLESTIGEAYTTGREGTTPVFRFASPTGKHFYTSDQNEVNSLGNLGYKSEGTAFYSPSKQAASAAASAPAPSATFAAPTPPAPAAVPQKKYDDPLQTQDFREADREEVKPRGQISTEFGIDPSFFGGEDLEYARKQGFQDREIKDFLDKNIQGLLRKQNLPGGGGLYDQLRV